MPQITQVKERLEDFETAKYITNVLRDISAIELKAYREKFERNAAFYTELQDLYRIVRRIATTQNKMLDTRRAGDTLFVAYTTNRHFYGSLNYNVIRECGKTVGARDRVLIIGSTGKELWQQKMKKVYEISYLAFEDDVPTEKEIHLFLERVAPFRQVYVFYPGFTSVYRQEVQMLDITFQQGSDEKKENETLPEYILEPEIINMFSFFDIQIRYVLFERLLLETQLSRIAARLMKMDTADENAGRLITAERRELRHAYAMFSSIRLLETLSCFIQWHKNKTPIK